MKLFQPIREYIARTDPVVKLLRAERIQNRVVRVILQFVPLLAAIFIPILVSYLYGNHLPGTNYSLFYTPSVINHNVHNFFRLSIYAGFFYFCVLPTIVCVTTGLLATRFVQAADYALVRLTSLENRYRVLGILRAALGRTKILVITSVGILVLILRGTFEKGSFMGFYKSQIFPGVGLVIGIWDPDPLPQNYLVLSLIGITILCAIGGIVVSAKLRLAIPSYIVAGIGSTIITLLLCLAYTALIDCIWADETPYLMPGFICHANKKSLRALAAIPFGLAYGAFRLAERWI